MKTITITIEEEDGQLVDFHKLEREFRRQVLLHAMTRDDIVPNEDPESWSRRRGISKAARELKMHRRTLQRMLVKMNLKEGTYQ